MHKHIAFVRPASEDQQLCDIKPEPVKPENALSGEEAQAFYDELLGLPSTSSCIYPQPAITGRLDDAAPVDSSDEEDNPKRSHVQPTPKDLLMLAQNGQHKELKRLLISKKLDVNLQDAYGWTALHCASYEGHLSCIKSLLKFGANTSIKDNKGRTAVELCKRRKNHSAYHLILNFGKTDNILKKQCSPPDIIKCPLCHTDYDAHQADRHYSSIVHRAAEELKSKTSYGIPEVNVGFKMLESMGWEKDAGLGPEGQGRKFPIKTKLKRDREGLGSSKDKPRVTHFDPNDQRAVKKANMDLEVKPKKAYRRQFCKDKNLEREFRRAFY